MPDGEENIEKAKGHRRHGEEVHRGERIAVVVQKRLPGCSGSSTRPIRPNVPRHCPFGDVKAEFEKLTMDTRGLPVILRHHATDEVLELGVGTRGRCAASRHDTPVGARRRRWPV
jgi:hypothetical protein